MPKRRERRKRRIQRGRYAVEVEVEVVYPTESSAEPCLEPATVHWLNEVVRRAEAGNLGFLHDAGRVFQVVPR